MCSPKIFGVCKVKQSHAEVALSLGRLVPGEQGAADLYQDRKEASARLRTILIYIVKMRFWDPPKNALDFEGVP